MTSKNTPQNTSSQLEETPKLNDHWIDSNAYSIVKRLKAAGHTTYLVGGCIRDLLLGINPKDYDLGTMARPQQVRRLIKNAFVIGRRFKLVLVKRKDNQYEVATFRRDPSEEEKNDETKWGDNLFGSPKEDAFRRDFTINALFYDPVEDILIDEVGGLDDLKNGWIKIIGEPEKRIEEDPVRSLRAIRLKYKINFGLEPSLRYAIQNTAALLEGSALPRRREEYLKFLRTQSPLLPFIDCYDFGLTPYILPTLHKILEDPNKRQVFTSIAENYYHQKLRTSEPIELFSGLIFAFVRAEIAEDPKQELTISSLLKNPLLTEFSKRELGLFNYEHSYVLRALQLQPFLHNKEGFLRRGQRRQNAALNNASFPLALKFAAHDYSVSAEDLCFWQERYKNRDKSVKFEDEEEV